MQIPANAMPGLHPENSDILPGDSGSIVEWLMTETRDERFIDNIFVKMCEKLNQAGIPVSRGTLHFRILHPQWLGARILWTRGMTEADIAPFGFGVEDSERYRNSPVNEIRSGAPVVRQRLEPAHAASAPPYSLYDELRAEGHTDYVAWPLKHTLGKHHIITFGSDRPGGFTDDDVAALADLLPAFALVSEIRLKNRLARTLLETYVGPHASEQILAGATTRGSGVTVRAAILICDLRDFTGISDMWPRDDVIELLNGYFDAMAEPIEKHGGEILKFMGDGLLAIFPLDKTSACGDLLAAIREAQASMAALNEENVKKGHQALGYGIGVHVGDVMYGNIGSRSRLDFTVIGPTVNVASRLESLTKELKRPVLLSQAFAEMAQCQTGLENLGSYTLRGLSEPIGVYAF